MPTRRPQTLTTRTRDAIRELLRLLLLEYATPREAVTHASAACHVSPEYLAKFVLPSRAGRLYAIEVLRQMVKSTPRP